LPSWILIRILNSDADPDPDPATQIYADPVADPDLQPWFSLSKTLTDYTGIEPDPRQIIIDPDPRSLNG
jgi:hypothetical protein